MRQLNKVLQITRRDRQTRFRSAKKNNRQELKSPGRPRKPPEQKTMHTRSVWRRKERRLRKSTRRAWSQLRTPRSGNGSMMNSRLRKKKKRKSPMTI